MARAIHFWSIVTLLIVPIAAVEPTATIDAGVVIGTTTALPSATAVVNKFLGIPFAKSPPTRFAPPEKPDPFTKPIEATKWSAACFQQFPYPKATHDFDERVFNNAHPAESEDCLYLNVYAPSSPPPPDGRSVLYWIYGGSLEQGDAGLQGFDGSWFAAYEDVVVVSINYRTNGFLDQRFGLDWVQRNIEQFGGSPEKVTIFGESAGALSIDAMLTSYPPDSTPPFRGAILESGQISFGPGLSSSATPGGWNQLSKALGCPGNYSSDLACVRAAPANEIKHIITVQSLLFRPIPDNVTLVSDPGPRRSAGQIAHIPSMGGTNAQEGRVFEVNQNNTAAFLKSELGDAATPEVISTIEKAYPLGKNGLNTPYDQISQIYTEFVFQCPQALWANATAAAGIPTWRYYFNASFENTQVYPKLGVFHSSEIGLVFSTYLYAPVNVTTQEYALSSAMRSTWAKFAKNPAGGPGWNQVGSGNAGSVLVGATDLQLGGIYLDSQGSPTHGAWDLGLWGNRYDSMGSGVTVIDQYEVDYRCSILAPIAAKLAG